MKAILNLKKEQETKVSELLKKCFVFFAFSNEQFEKNKTPLKDGEKYTSIGGGGGYLPKGQVENFLNGMKIIEKWYKEEIRKNKNREENIKYELANHEAYYTGTIYQTLEALGEGYTYEEVWKIYKHERRHNIN